jgi:hypothetical protein
MAAPHVTGLAALVLAHHPDFKNPFSARSADRVDRLLQILKLSARPINLGDPRRTGAGLPDAVVAVGLQQTSQFAPQGFFPGNGAPPAGVAQPLTPQSVFYPAYTIDPAAAAYLRLWQLRQY